MDAPSDQQVEHPTLTLKSSLLYTSSVSGGVSRSQSQHEALTARSSPLSDTGDYEVEARVLRNPTHARLRKKPKSISITSTSTIPENNTPGAHMRRVSGIQKTLSIPSFRTQPEPEDPRPQSSHSTTRPTTPLRRQSSNLGPNRSPSQKRKPPASHSSYGIETTLGPPPSYSTQRTLSQDRVWSVNQNSTTRERVTPQLHEESDTPKQIQPDRVPLEETSTLQILQTIDIDASSPETLDTQSVTTPQLSDMTPPTSADGSNIKDDADPTIRGLGLDSPLEDPKASSSEETNKSEDLFLNIAKTDASRPAEPVIRLDKRRSRISLPFLSGSRPSTAATSSPMAPPIEDEHHVTRTEIPRRFGKRSSLGQHVPGALTSPRYFDDSRSTVSRLADHTSTAESNTGRPSTRSRRYSNANADSHLRPPSRSQTGRSSRLVSENLYTSRFKPAEQPPTESTVSTTAPSTVWDELDDLKSRIKKLELTGKLPPSSAAAMASSERPRTATTQATTMSSSPKHKPSISALPSAIEGIPSTTHPLLHEALSNAKSSISNDVFQKLQATASDALQLSAMTSQETTLRGLMSPTDERQIRRRTEAMCRSLTELAIALLSESRAVSSPAARPASRDAGSASALRSRRTSNEHTDRPPVTMRVQSRLDSRRTSLLNQQSASSPAQATEFDTSAASVVSQPGTTSRLISRTSTATRHRRTPGQVDGADDAEESPSIRPVSRAMTDIGSGHRQTTRDRTTFSREYTKQHPLPLSQVDTMSNTTPLPANLVSRRTYPMPSHQTGTATVTESPSPITPSYQPTPTSTHIPFQRPPFTISIERRKPSYLSESPVSQSTPESNPGSGQRQASGRRSLGFASRFSNVSSRLKAVRAERMANSSASRSPPKDGAEGIGEDQENMPTSMQTRATAEDAGIVGEDS